MFSVGRPVTETVSTLSVAVIVAELGTDLDVASTGLGCAAAAVTSVNTPTHASAVDHDRACLRSYVDAQSRSRGEPRAHRPLDTPGG